VFHHESQKAKQKNREKIQDLQKENKELREQLKSRVIEVSIILLGSSLISRWLVYEFYRH